MWQAIAQAGAQLAKRKLIRGSSGNISVRLDQHRILITKHGARLDRIDPSSVMELDLSSEAGDPAASIELPVHRLIYLTHPWAGAIVHAHPPHVILASKLLAELDYPVVEAPAGSQLLASKVAAAMQLSPGVIARAHGSFCAGRDLDQALELTFELEARCIQALRSKLSAI